MWGVGTGFSALVTLSVAHNALNGVIPPTWGQQSGMAALRFFNGSFNLFSGTLPQEWGSVPLKLNGLDVGNNTLTGVERSFLGRRQPRHGLLRMPRRLACRRASVHANSTACTAGQPAWCNDNLYCAQQHCLPCDAAMLRQGKLCRHTPPHLWLHEPVQPVGGRQPAPRHPAHILGECALPAGMCCCRAWMGLTPHTANWRTAACV